jgi:hypothetical protein
MAPVLLDSPTRPGRKSAFPGETAATVGMGSNQMALKRAREAQPLWVWLALVLLVGGGIAYAMVVAIIELMMATNS